MTAARFLEPTRRPVVRVILGPGQRWVVRCETCGRSPCAGTARADADQHATWHRDEHRRAHAAAGRERDARRRLAEPADIPPVVEPAPEPTHGIPEIAEPLGEVAS